MHTWQRFNWYAPTIGGVHPIERLRYAARAGHVPIIPLVREAAMALSAFADDRMGLLTACRRLVRRRLGCGPLVWLAARMLTGADACQEARDAMQRIRRDPTAAELAHALPVGASVLATGPADIAARVLGGCELIGAADRPPDLLLIESDCVGPHRAVVSTDALHAARSAQSTNTRVWLVAGVGRTLPALLYEAFSGENAPSHRLGTTAIDLDSHVTRLVTPVGVRTPAEARARRQDCPIALELIS